MNCIYENGKVYGLIGYNGSGKTTLLKTIAGIFRQEEGEILAEGVSTYENEEIQEKFFSYETEGLFFDPQSTPDGMRRIYRGYYPTWSDELYGRLLHLFGLEGTAKIAGFSKGMQRQTGLLLALSVMPRYLFLDETFDGLDIAKRQMLTKILKNYTSRRNALAIVTSHYLNELEHIADEIGMIDGDRLYRSRYPRRIAGKLFYSKKARWMKMKSNVSSTEKSRGFSKKKRDEKDGAAFSRSENKDGKRRDGNSGSGNSAR